LIKQIKIIKKLTGLVWFGFGFINLKPKKPNKTQTKKPEKNESNQKKNESNKKNQIKLVFILKN